MTTSIQKIYNDALFYASAPFNKNEVFYLTPSEYKVLIKLIHYSTSYEDITFQNKDISTHIFLSELTVKDSIEALLNKNYITSSRDIFNNRLGFKSKRTIYINWDTIKEIAELARKYERPTSTAEANIDDLSNDNSIEEPIPQPAEIVPQSEQKTHCLQDYAKDILGELAKRKANGESIDERKCLLYIRTAFDAGKIKKPSQLSIENINKVIDKFIVNLVTSI